jgi:hypothetical protein
VVGSQGGWQELALVQCYMGIQLPCFDVVEITKKLLFGVSASMVISFRVDSVFIAKIDQSGRGFCMALGLL